ncbi:MAG TPA: ATP-binding protein [Gemmatimonadales bacterium]|nr:ATP-binding protein [Gemmatimonadales bacterium]
MIDPIRRLLTEAGHARQTKAFWQAAADILSGWVGGAQVQLVYKGLNESGTVQAGAPGDGEPFISEHHDAEGRHVVLTVRGLPQGFPGDVLQSGVEIATHLAVMVARRAALERERRLGTFLVELSRWLLAAPERELLLRYTLQSVTSLVEAQGAFVALRQRSSDTLAVVATVGQCVELEGFEIGLKTSAIGRVVRTGESLLTDNILAEPDSQLALNPSGTARGAMMVPLKTSTGVVGALGVLRYLQPGAEDSAPAFGLVDLQYLGAIAAYIAGGLELSEAVTGARAAAERAHAMVNSSPLPLALVDRDGRVQQLNDAGCRLFGIASESQALGLHLEALGLSPSEVSLRLVLARPAAGDPWHGRVLVSQPGGDRRICDCTVTGLSGVRPDNLLVALYDRTDELRAQRELIAREKLATVGEIASGVAHEVNNPLAAIRMEAELLGRASKDPETSTTAATIQREVDRAARIVRSLLRLARRADTTPKQVQINDLVHDVAEIRQRVMRTENVQFRTSLDEAAPAVLGLGQELQQVVINLVTNAEYAVKGREPAVIQLTSQAREGWVRLVVEDSGPGVPPEIRGRIFDPFFTTKGPDEGTGLGLAICQRVVTEVGGKIWLEDSELGGARFVVEMPAAPLSVATTIG